MPCVGIPSHSTIFSFSLCTHLPRMLTRLLLYFPTHRAVLASSLSITPMQPQRLSSPHSPLRYRMLWNPVYPLPPTTVELVVLKAAGGRWRFDIQLEVSTEFGQTRDTASLFDSISRMLPNACALKILALMRKVYPTPRALMCAW